MLMLMSSLGEGIVINHGSTVEDAYQGLVAETPGHEVHGSGF